MQHYYQRGKIGLLDRKNTSSKAQSRIFIFFN
jgi:hypothetical protein